MLQEIKMLSSEFQPLSEYLLVKVEEPSNTETTASGLMIVTRKSVTQRPCSGIIIALGKDCADISVGDYVVFPDKKKNV